MEIKKSRLEENTLNIPNTDAYVFVENAAFIMLINKNTKSTVSKTDIFMTLTLFKINIKDVNKVIVKKYSFINSKFSLKPTTKSSGVTKTVKNSMFLASFTILLKYITLLDITKGNVPLKNI